MKKTESALKNDDYELKLKNYLHFSSFWVLSYIYVFRL
jgi:hypothetical protein